MIKDKKIYSSEPDLGLILKYLGERLSAKFKCHRVGKIKKLNTDRLTVDVELLDKLVFRDSVTEITELSDLPLLIYGGANSSLTFGNIAGCECIVHFNDTDIDNWYSTGEAYEPNTGRQHDFADGFVELRPYSLPKKMTYDTSGVILCNGAIKIKLLDSGNLEFTNGSANIVMSGNKVTVTGDVDVIGKSNLQGDVTITGKVDITGDVSVTGKIDATGIIKSQIDCVSGAISGASHTHTDSLGGNTSTPH